MSTRSLKFSLSIAAGKYYRSTVQMEAQSDNATYVPMGDGLKWATMNVGANSAEEYGDYFAWGETTPKDWYDWSTYQWCEGNYDTLTKYCTNSSYGYNGFTDGKIELEDIKDRAGQVGGKIKDGAGALGGKLKDGFGKIGGAFSKKEE